MHGCADRRKAVVVLNPLQASIRVLTLSPRAAHQNNAVAPAGMDALAAARLYERKALPAAGVAPLAVAYISYVALSNLRCAQHRVDVVLALRSQTNSRLCMVAS